MKDTDKKQGISQEARALALVANVAAVVREGLHELVVRSGLGVVGAMLEADREALCGPRYEHSEHGAHRAGHVRGELAMGGRRVEVKRPRVRSIEGRESYRSRPGSTSLGSTRSASAPTSRCWWESPRGDTRARWSRSARA